MFFKIIMMKITLVRMSTESPPMEAPKIVFTIAKATTPPSAPVDYEVMMLMRLFMYSITVLFHRVPLIARSWDLGSEEVET